MVNNPLCTCGAATILAVGDRSPSFQSTPFVPLFLCTVCPTPPRIPESVWASSAPEYLTSKSWRNYQTLPAQASQTTHPAACQPASGYTPQRPQQAIPSAPAVSVTAKSSPRPPPAYEVALADSTAQTLARHKQVLSKRRSSFSKPKQSTDQVRVHMFALREKSITLANPSRPHKSLVAFAVTVGVNPFGGRSLLVARLISSL